MSEKMPESCDERELILFRNLKPGPVDRDM